MGKQTSKVETVNHTTYKIGRKTHRATVVRMRVTCGNAGCICMRKGVLHGPYLYIRVRDGRKVRYIYQGKSRQSSEQARQSRLVEPPDWYEFGP